MVWIVLQTKVLWISAAPTIWLLAQQHSSTVCVIKCPGSILLLDMLIRSTTWLYRGDLRGCLEDIRSRKATDIGNLWDHSLMVAMQVNCSHQAAI